MTKKKPDLPKEIRRIFSSEKVEIYHGHAEDWPGDPDLIDLVFTNPYGPLPSSLHDKPMIVHQWMHRVAELEKWTGVKHGSLQLLSPWNLGREAFYVANVPLFHLDVANYRPEPGGWYPPDMVDAILAEFSIYNAPLIQSVTQRPFTVWDGFTGRGTIGKGVLARGWRYVGVEELSPHIALALDYLGVPK